MLLTKASDPNQYDQQEVSWESEISLDSPSRAFFWEYLQNYLQNLDGKKLIDIGAGTGWLLKTIQTSDVLKAVGIEPSNKNVEIARRANPKAEIVCSSFEDYMSEEQFDIAVAIMSFNHIKNLSTALKKVNEILNGGGSFFLIIPDYDFFRNPEEGYEFELEDIDENQYVVMVKRPQGAIADIVRKPEMIIDEGEKIGLKLVEEVLMKPTESLIEKAPEYLKAKDIPITRLLYFKK